MIRPTFLLAAALACASATAASAQAADPMRAETRRQSAHVGEMTATAPAGRIQVDDALRSERYQQLEERFARDDIVFLMRHGPTDWSKLDAEDVAPDWTERGPSPSVPDTDATGFLDEIARLSAGLSDTAFEIEDVRSSDDTITVRGLVTGRHAGELLGVAATGREVAFGGLALHRVEDGAIAESWQMVDWTTLMRLISPR